MNNETFVVNYSQCANPSCDHSATGWIINTDQTSYYRTCDECATRTIRIYDQAARDRDDLGFLAGWTFTPGDRVTTEETGNTLAVLKLN